MLYLDNAATTKINSEVLNEMLKELEHYGNSEAKFYEQAENAKKSIKLARRKVAHIINAKSDDEIVFTSGATEATIVLRRNFRRRIMERQKIFFTSDLHFGHENVLRFDDRPFETVEEMDEELINRWNDKVGKGDLVYVLGDLIWKTAINEAVQIIKRLNGQIILIKGNHDRFLHNAAAKKALAGIKDYDDICVTLDDGTVRRCILSHYFIPFYNGHRYNAVHLHGHSHFTAEATEEFLIAKTLNEKGYNLQIYNVGCMYWNYVPVTLDEILKTKDQRIEEK